MESKIKQCPQCGDFNCACSDDEQRWRYIGQWWEKYFSLKFMPGNLPQPKDALYGSRLRVQIETKGGWEEWAK